MKKLLIIMCAALFVAAMVLPAAAADMSLSGFYRIRGFYQSNAGTVSATDSASAYGVTPWDGTTPYTTLGYGSSNAWWDHMLQLNPVFKVADNLKLVTQVSAFNNQMFGSSQTSGACVTSASEFAGSATKNYNASADNVLVNRAYIDWKTGVGTFKLGRQAAGVTFLPFANTTTDADRIRWDSNAWNGLQFGAYMQKSAEKNAISGSNISDEDSNTYRISVTYTQPCYFLGYALDYGHDRTSSNALNYKANTVTHNIGVKANDPTKTYFFQGELQLLQGDSKDYYGTTADIDKKGLGYYAAVGMTKGPLTVALATTFVSGDDVADATDHEAKAGSSFGLDFQPLYIVFSPYANILTSQSGGHGRCMTALDTGVVDTGARAYAIVADYAVNPQLALHAGFGAAYADKTSAGINDEFGKEFDLGLKYQIMSNLAYELHAGYLWTGDFFKHGSSNYTTDDVYQIDHSLTLSF